MTSLPSQHPHLALHLTDRALTPIISSSSSSSSPQRQHHHHHHHHQQKQPPNYPRPKRPTFSTSPPESPSDDSAPSSPSTTTSSTTTTATQPEAEEEEEEDEEEEEALTSLSSTALSAYDAAKRLGKGAPLRTMVEYPDGGLVVLHSYMCPMSLALGTPGRNASSTSLQTAAGAVAALVPSSEERGLTASMNYGDGERPRTPTANTTITATARPLSSGLMDPAGLDSDDEGEDSPNAPPMLISTVVAPRAEDLREARRAAGSGFSKNGWMEKMVMAKHLWFTKSYIMDYGT
ncbi:hypothetical protein VP1G_08922 [Cytospora mali]|uniref:Uncharacterized protein n=1 Tax=Cytospora mali TaxID=578113 RepID=A0A194VCP0_CYTMA|nr:hypothetical protein VP1G_08922 [Valsa mali var. pyri (nom. inval.)]